MPQARYPSPGSTIRTPRLRRISRFACVAGWFHMLTFMAGATTTGAVVARYNVVRKSLAMPCANFARMSAVAGTTSNASIAWATAMCSTAESMLGWAFSSPAENISVMTFSPESAAKVSGRTNSCAALVMMTCTADAAVLQQADNFRRLVGCDTAADTESYFHGSSALLDDGCRFDDLIADRTRVGSPSSLKSEIDSRTDSTLAVISPAPRRQLPRPSAGFRGSPTSPCRP